jgi:hypothetical protein
MLVVAMDPKVQSIVRIMSNGGKVHNIRALVMMVIHQPNLIVTPRYWSLERDSLHGGFIHGSGSTGVPFSNLVSGVLVLIF